MKNVILSSVSLFTAATFAMSAAFADKKEILTDLAPAPIGLYSQAIQVDKTIYISGQIPIDPTTGELVKGDFAAQAERTIQNLAAIAKAAGGSLDHIVKLTVYLDDLKNFALVNEAMKNYFHAPYPARAVIEIKALPKQAPIEIEAIMQL